MILASLAGLRVISDSQARPRFGGSLITKSELSLYYRSAKRQINKITERQINLTPSRAVNESRHLKPLSVILLNFVAPSKPHDPEKVV
jgi:hypothetical protein